MKTFGVKTVPSSSRKLIERNFIRFIVPAALVGLLCCAPYAHAQKLDPLAGRYFTADALLSKLQDPATEKSAELYLMGAYDLAQDSGQSCAGRGSTTPTLLAQVFSNYLHAHPELVNANRTAAGIAAQAFAEFWPCHGQQTQPMPAAEPKAQIDSAAGAGEITIRVQGAFGMREGFGTVYRTNVFMPAEFNDNNGHWSLTCNHLLSHGSYTATYDTKKNKLQLFNQDMKGRQQTTKCEVFTHDWRER